MEMVKAKVVGKNMERILGFVLCVSVWGGGGCGAREVGRCLPPN